MKKRIFVTMLALTAAAGIAASPLQAEAAGKVQIIGGNFGGDLNGILNGSNCSSIAGAESLKAFLENCGLWGVIRPELPQKPEAPEQPETPEVPEVPETPEIPDKPETETPETPDKPVTPEQPVNPDKPVTSEKPETPDKPEVEKPEKPESGKPDKMTFAERVVELVNKERAKAGLKPVTIHNGVKDAALVRAKEIKSKFSHTRPDGTSCFTALKEQNVTYRSAGENIAWGQKSPEEVMNAWMNSDGHRANILNEKFTQIGVGHYKGSNGRDYWAQMFIY